MLQKAADHIPNFHYLGEIPNSEVNKQLSQSHILVNTSQYEGFSNTFVQAWMRKVVVVSLNSNPDGLLTDKEIGFVSGNPDELEKTIGDLVDNRDTIEKIGKRPLIMRKQITPMH
ncbi:glycosyltransferase [Fluviicola sp.]|uniref:glycosyltransferase n=1 Tax=Fluviicola sp. TaxID=1917219 RepID=UPI003D28924E